MWEINETFDDYSHPTNKGWIYLNADQEMNPYQIKYPITWTGFVSNNKVIIIQNSQSSKFIEGYEFKVFPEKYSDIKNQIVSIIDKYLRVLD